MNVLDEWLWSSVFKCFVCYVSHVFSPNLNSLGQILNKIKIILKIKEFLFRTHTCTMGPKNESASFVILLGKSDLSSYGQLNYYLLLKHRERQTSLKKLNKCVWAAASDIRVWIYCISYTSALAKYRGLANNIFFTYEIYSIDYGLYMYVGRLIFRPFDFTCDEYVGIRGYIMVVSDVPMKIEYWHRILCRTITLMIEQIRFPHIHLLLYGHWSLAWLPMMLPLLLSLLITMMIILEYVCYSVCTDYNVIIYVIF